MLPRRERRQGVRYMENDRDREHTFNKRRAGLFKSAADLTALTSAKVSIVMQTDNGKMHSFGTPSVDPIMDTFMSGCLMMGPLTDEETSKRISRLEKVVVRLDMQNAEAEKQRRLSIQRTKKLQDKIVPGITVSFLSSKKKDLNLEDLSKLFTDLTQIQKEIQHRLPPLHHDPQPQNGARTSAPLHMLPSGGLYLSWDHRSLLPVSPPLQSSLSPLRPLQQPSLSPLPTPQHSSMSPVPIVQPPPPPPVASLVLPLQHNIAPLFPMQKVPPPMEPQTYNSHIMEMGSGSNGNALQMMPSIEMPSAVPLPPSPLQSHPDQVEDQLPSPLQLHPEYFASTTSTIEPPQIHPSPDPKFQQCNDEASPLLVHSGGNEFSASDVFADDHWANALSDQPYYGELLWLDDYTGYTSTDVGLGDMENIVGWADTPPALRPCGGDASTW